MRGTAAWWVAAAMLVTGCGGAADDELQPRPTATVTVTAAPEPATVPDDLPFTDAPPSAEVVWALGTQLHQGATAQDLAPITPEEIVVVPGGLLILAEGELWFTDGREAVGLAFSPVERVALSRDGSQVLVATADRDEPVGYDAQEGTRVEAADLGRPRDAERDARGPGAFEVRPAGGTTVVDAAGEPVEVVDLPPDFRASTWLGESTAAGLAEIDGEPVVHVCDLAPARGPAGCEVAPDPIGAAVSQPYVFARYPGG